MKSIRNLLAITLVAISTVNVDAKISLSPRAKAVLKSANFGATVGAGTGAVLSVIEIGLLSYGKVPDSIMKRTIPYLKTGVVNLYSNEAVPATVQYYSEILQEDTSAYLDFRKSYARKEKTEACLIAAIPTMLITIVIGAAIGAIVGAVRYKEASIESTPVAIEPVIEATLVIENTPEVAAVEPSIEATPVVETSELVA